MTTIETIAASEEIEELRLTANGLQVLLVPAPEVPVVSVCIVYRVGSRNEAVGYTGATHLLEHLMFKGSSAFDPAAGRPIARVLERVGATFNATTWFDRTSYYETVPPEHIELALALEADRMRNALLRPEDLASELTVVRNEFERGENDPFDALLKDSFAIAFREHPYHHPTIGWRDDIENATIERLRGFYDTFYHPDNATLIVVGAFDRAETLQLIETHFAPIAPAPSPAPPVTTHEPPQQGERRFVIRRSGELGWVVVSWRTPEAAHPDTHALAVLADALTSGVTSRLYQKLVDTGRCIDVQAVSWQLRDPGLFQIFACLNSGVDHDEIEREIRAELARIAADGLDEHELERSRNQVEAQTAFLRDSPAQIAGALTESVSCADWRFYEEYPERIRAVTREDIIRVATATFHDDAVSVGFFVPRNGGGERHGGEHVPTPGPQPCHYRPEVAPRVRRAALPGGAEVLTLPRPHNPTVTLHGSLLAGHGMLPQADWTAASLVPDMLERGTARHDRLALARLLEDRGIEFDVSADAFNPLEVHVSGRCLTRHLPLLLETLVETLREPTFPEGELEKLRQLRLGELAQAQEETFLRAFEAFCRHVYPRTNPNFRRPVAERSADLERVSRDALVAAHGRLFGPASLIVGIVGDCDPDDVARRLGGLLEGWNGGEGEPEIGRTPADVAPRGGVLEGMEDKPSLDVVLGHPGDLRRRDDDFLATILGNSILGHSTLTSRLGMRLRDREGLTYGVISRFVGASLLDGPWITTFTVAPQDLDRSLAAAFEEIERFVREGPDETELSDERAAMAGSYRVALATSSGLARELVRLIRHDLSIAEIDGLPERIRAVTGDEVRAAMRRHLQPGHMSVAVAGTLPEEAAERFRGRWAR